MSQASVSSNKSNHSPSPFGEGVRGVRPERGVVRSVRWSFRPLLSFLFLLSLTSCFENFDQRLQREAREYTENHCPAEPEPGTRLDSTVYTPSTRTYTTYYSVAPANEAALRTQSSQLHALLVNELVANVDFKRVKDEGVTFAYVYRSQTSGAVVYETRIGKGEY